MADAPFLDMPTTACAASVIITMIRTVGRSESPYTLEDQVFKWPGAAWMMEFTMPPFTSRRAFADWQAFFLKLQGTYGTFLCGDPSAKAPRGVGTGTPLVDGIAQTGNLLLTKGWTPNTNGIMLKGDYIQLGTAQDSHLYMLVEDANSDALGKATLTLEPELRVSPADSSAIVINNPKGVFRLTSNDIAWSVRPGPVYSIGFQAREVINA